MIKSKKVYQARRYTDEELEELLHKITIPVQRYTKSELADLYKKTVPTLMSWINQNPILLDELKKAGGYRNTLREFRKEHVRLIFAYLGEP